MWAGGARVRPGAGVRERALEQSASTEQKPKADQDAHGHNTSCFQDIHASASARVRIAGLRSRVHGAPYLPCRRRTWEGHAYAPGSTPQKDRRNQSRRQTPRSQFLWRSRPWADRVGPDVALCAPPCASSSSSASKFRPDSRAQGRPGARRCTCRSPASCRLRRGTEPSERHRMRHGSPGAQTWRSGPAPCTADTGLRRASPCT